MSRMAGAEKEQPRKPIEKSASAVAETVDQSIGLRQFDESFDQTFSKVCGVEGAKPSSPPAGGEITFLGVSFCELFLCAYMLKEKADKRFCAIFI